MSKINKTFTVNADLDIIMLKYNLLEYSDNQAIESFWNYYGDETNDAVDENVNNNRIKNNNRITSKYFDILRYS